MDGEAAVGLGGLELVGAVLVGGGAALVAGHAFKGALGAADGALGSGAIGAWDRTHDGRASAGPVAWVMLVGHGEAGSGGHQKNDGDCKGAGHDGCEGCGKGARMSTRWIGVNIR